MVPWLSRCALRLWRELVAVLLGKGSELLLYPRIRRRCQKVVHPRGEKMINTLVGSVPGFEGWWTVPRGTTTNEPVGAVILRVSTRTVSSPSKT